MAFRNAVKTNRDTIFWMLRCQRKYIGDIMK